MQTLILFFLAGENVRSRYTLALRDRGLDADLVLALPGAGSTANAQYVLLSPGDALESRLERVARRMGALPLDRYGRIVLASFSAGYGAVREILEDPRSAARVDGYCAIDSVHDGSALARLDWLETFARRAMAGETVLALGHSDVPTYDYASTTDVAQELCRRLALDAPRAGEAIERGALRVSAYDVRPASQAAAEHSAALLEWGPELLGWCVSRVAALTSDEPALEPDPSWTLGERCLWWIGGELAHDPREIPGDRHDPRILSYSRHCRRGGRLLGVSAPGVPSWDGGTPLPLPRDEDAWCAAAQSAALLGALRPGESPSHGARVSVRELVEDARAADTLRGLDYAPRPGDLAIEARSGGDPLLGGVGHVRCVVGVDGDRYLGVGGNEGNRWVYAYHPLRSSAWRAWIARA